MQSTPIQSLMTVQRKVTGPIPTSPAGQVGRAAKPGAAETPVVLIFSCLQMRRENRFSCLLPVLLLFAPLVPLHVSLPLSLSLSLSLSPQ